MSKEVSDVNSDKAVGMDWASTQCSIRCFSCCRVVIASMPAMCPFPESGIFCKCYFKCLSRESGILCCAISCISCALFPKVVFFASAILRAFQGKWHFMFCNKLHFMCPFPKSCIFRKCYFKCLSGEKVEYYVMQ